MAKRKLPKPLPQEQALAIRDVCLSDTNYYQGRADHVLICLLLHGLRASEAANLEVTEVNFEKSSLVVRGGKGNVDRFVPMDQVLAHSIQQHLTNTARQVRLTGYVLHTPRDTETPITRKTVLRRVKRRAIDAEVPNPAKVHPHRFRHTFAVRFLEAGGNVRALQKILGHSNLTTTEVYLDITGEQVAEEAQRVGMMG